jgi:hypothetical protein
MIFFSAKIAVHTLIQKRQFIPPIYLGENIYNWQF